MPTYEQLTVRNTGYVTAELQERMRTTRILVAGCGIGSCFAEAALRLGFEQLILADGDTVSATNLNRQNFVAEDVGEPKVDALARRLRSINPAAAIRTHRANLTEQTIGELVAQADLVFDTIDFLDLPAIVATHDECRRQSKPAITTLSIGWGAGCIYFPVGAAVSFRSLFGLPETGSVGHLSYVDTFALLIERLAQRLDPTVIAVVRKALTVMADGTPCPASQVSPGAYCVGALGATLAVRLLAGQAVVPAPHLLLADMMAALTVSGIDLSRDS